MPKNKKSSARGGYAWALARISLGLIFLWAFIDKLWGLGFATCRNVKTGVVTEMCKQAWVNGGSPTTGFLKFGTKGPFAEFYRGLAGNHLIDVLFMAGLLLIGVALIFGIGMKIAAISGSLLLFMMWTATLWPANNPLLDDHIVYIFVLIGLALNNTDQKLGLRNWWIKQDIVKRFPVLE